MKEELPVLGIETDDIRRQHVDGEIRRELRNVLAGLSRSAGLAATCHDFTRTLPRAPARRCRAYSSATGISSSSSRAGISRTILNLLVRHACAPRRTLHSRGRWKTWIGGGWPGRTDRPVANLAGSIVSSPAMMICVGQCNRKAVRLSRGGKRPTTGNNLRRIRIRRNHGRLCSLGNPCIHGSRRIRARRPVRRSWRPRCSPCRRHRMSPG